MQDIIRRLQNLEITKDLRDRDLKELASAMQIVHLGSRDILFKKDDSIKYIFLILAGSIKVQQPLNSTETKIFNFLGRGEFLGVTMASLPNPKYPTCAQCNEDCTFLKIPINFFFTRMLSIPKVQREVNRQISERFLEFQNDICTAQHLVPSRVADFLIRMSERQELSQGQRIQIPLTRADIADRIGAQSETVIRILSRWTKLGWVTTTDRYIEILNKKALREVESERPSKKPARAASRNIKDDSAQG